MGKIADLTLSQVIESLYYTVVTDEKANIICISRNYRELLGLSKEEIIGKHISEVIPTSRVPVVTETRQEEIGYLFELANGQNAVCNRIPIWEDDKFIGVITTATFANVGEVDMLNVKIKKLHEENQKYKKAIQSIQNQSLHAIVGNSNAMVEIKNTISRIAPTNMTVLITGETGTGKEVFSNAIHKLSGRYNQKFIKINCAAIPKDLLESELFGYEAGSFSGANKKWQAWQI